MSEEDPSKKIQKPGSGMESLADMPSWKEHVKELNNSGNDATKSPDDLAPPDGSTPPPEGPNPGETLEAEKSKEQRQVDDLEVLFSFCDEKDVLEILRSDDYGVLLDNNVSLVDLFNANALFDEQYYSDGYPKEEWRGYSAGIKLMAKRYKRNSDIMDHHAAIHHAYMKADKYAYDDAQMSQVFLDEAHEMEENGLDNGDKERAAEAKEAIAIIRHAYFSEDSPVEDRENFREILSLRAQGKEISEEQKVFLSRHFDKVNDRLLYEGHSITPERANLVWKEVGRMEEDMESDERGEYGFMAEQLGYVFDVVKEFERYGRPDLVKGVRNRLAYAVNHHFDQIITSSNGDNGFLAKRDLFLNFYHPINMIDAAKEYDLVGEGYIEPNEIVDYLIIRSDGDYDSYLMYYAKDYKDLGVDDDAILDSIRTLSVHDFDKNPTYSEGLGNKLVDAAIDMGKIAKKLFIDSPNIFAIDPTDDDPENPEIPRSGVDILKDAGFEMTDIALACTPDVIMQNFKRFIADGADAKAMVKHMISYREEFEENIAWGDDDTYTSHKMWRNGVQPMIVWDENHPEGIRVMKEGMDGEGADYVFANLDLLAENGVTESDIIENMRGSDCAPIRYCLGKMLEQPRFDRQKVMDMAYKKYVEHCTWMKELGYISDDTFQRETNPQHYYAEIIKYITLRPDEDSMESLLKRYVVEQA